MSVCPYLTLIKKTLLKTHTNEDDKKIKANKMKQ